MKYLVTSVSLWYPLKGCSTVPSPPTTDLFHCGHPFHPRSVVLYLLAHPFCCSFVKLCKKGEGQGEKPLLKNLF